MQEEFSAVHAGALSINWPYNPTEVLITQTSQDHQNGRPKEQVIINPVFEQHIRDLHNWTLDSKVATVYPELYGACKV